jgi:outer membrane protein TolC
VNVRAPAVVLGLLALSLTACRGAPLGVRGLGAAATPERGLVAGTRTQVIDLPTAMRLAGADHLDTAIARQGVREAHARAVRAGRWWWPLLRPTVRFDAVDGLVQATEGTIVDVEKESAFVGVGLVFTGELGEGPYRALAAEQTSKARIAAARAVEGEAIARAGLAYLDLLEASALLTVSEEARAVHERVATESQANLDVGGGSEADLLRARARAGLARMRVARASGARAAAAAALREVLGLSHEVDLVPSEPAPLPLDLVRGDVPLGSLIAEATCGRAETIAARLAASAAWQEQRAAQEGIWLPDVRLGLETGWFGDGFGDLGASTRVGVGLSWDIGPGGIGDPSRAVEAAARAQQVRLETERLRRRIVREVETAYGEMVAGRAACEACGSAIADAERAAQLYAERETAGIGLPLESILAQEALTQARLEHVSATARFDRAQIRLLLSTGRLR